MITNGFNAFITFALLFIPFLISCDILEKIKDNGFVEIPFIYTAIKLCYGVRICE